MYYYLYDLFLNDNKYQKILHSIENRTVDLGINGKIGRVSMLLSPEKLIKEEIKKGVTTIVAVGNDETVNKLIKISAEKKITLGIIPVGKNNKIAKILGIPEGAGACDILSQRRVKKIDLIKINNHYCLSELKTEIKNAQIICENKYEVNLISKTGEAYIYNLADKNEIQKIFNLKQDINKYFNPEDGLLDLVIRPGSLNLMHKFLTIFKKNKVNINDVSIIPIKKIQIIPRKKEEISVICDSNLILKAPLNIKILPQALNVIVSKNRKF